MPRKAKIYKKKEKGTIVKDVPKNSSKRKKTIRKEKQNLEEANKYDLNAGVSFPGVVRFSEEDAELETEFISGFNLKDVKNLKLFKDFGRELKKLHYKDNVTHGELELQDVIVTKENEWVDGDFVLVDLPSLNRVSARKEYAKFKVSVHLWQLKEPWKWLSYNAASKAFREGYKPRDLHEVEIKENVDKTIRNYWSKGIIFKVKAIYLYLFLKPRNKRIAEL